MTVRFFGPANRASGYGSAVINFAKAFSRSSVDTKFILSGSESKIVNELNNYGGKTHVDFYLHGPPYNKHKSHAYKIAYFYWEADTLPESWGRRLHKINEIWAPCQLVSQACRKAGFRGIIKVVPTPCDDWTTYEKISIPSPLSKDKVVGENVYKFYSIFQWQNRKNYKTLLNSYLRAFNKNDNVLLILKVNPLNIAGYNVPEIKRDIIEIKRKLNLKYYPPIYLSTDIIPRESIHAIHNTADCYVSPHHGEGWGMPIHDALRAGNQVIVTKYGGVTEYLDDSSAHIIKHKLGPVKNMEWLPLYSENQNWAYPSGDHLIKIFRDVYENHQSYKLKAKKGSEIAEKMTIDALSRLIDKEFSSVKR